MYNAKTSYNNLVNKKKFQICAPQKNNHIGTKFALQSKFEQKLKIRIKLSTPQISLGIFG